MPEPILIDVRGLKCPLPVLKTERGMRDYPARTRFVVLATDPLASVDLPHFCAENGHRLVASGREGEGLRFEIEKA
jgi:tRNA 2-thiouridine synthesizing protein A